MCDGADQKTVEIVRLKCSVDRRIKEKTGSGLKKYGLMKNKFDTGMSKKRSAVVKKKAFMKWSRVRLAEGLHECEIHCGWTSPPTGEKDGEEKEEKKAEEMEMHAPGVEVGGMHLEEEIEEHVETCFEGFTCVCAADLQQEERSEELRDRQDHMWRWPVLGCGVGDSGLKQILRRPRARPTRRTAPAGPETSAT